MDFLFPQKGFYLNDVDYLFKMRPYRRARRKDYSTEPEDAVKKDQNGCECCDRRPKKQDKASQNSSDDKRREQSNCADKISQENETYHGKRKDCKPEEKVKEIAPVETKADAKSELIENIRNKVMDISDIVAKVLLKADSQEIEFLKCEEELTRCMIELDGIVTEGNRNLRELRKSVINKINQILDTILQRKK